MEVWMRISKAEQLCLKNLWWDNDRMLIHTPMSCTYKYPGNMNCFYLNTIWQAQEAYSSSTGTLWRETDCIQYVAHDMYMYRETAYARTMCNYICSQNNVRAVHPQRQCNNYDVKNSLLMWLCAKKLCTFIRIFNWTVYVHVHVCMAWLNYHVSSSLDQWSWWVPEQRLPPARVLASTSWQLDSVAGTTGGDSVVLWGGGDGW